MRRRLRAILTIVSAALFATAAGLWVRNAARYESVSWEREERRTDGSGVVEVREVGLFSVSGRLGLSWFWSEGVPFPLLTRYPPLPPPPPPPPGWRRAYRQQDRSEPLPWDPVPKQTTWSQIPGDHWSWMGFHATTSNRQRAGPPPSASRSHEYAVPCWFVMVATAIAPGRWAIGRWRRRRAARPGQCAGCGFDLRATPDRCPECGVVPAHASMSVRDGNPERD